MSDPSSSPEGDRRRRLLREGLLEALRAQAQKDWTETDLRHHLAKAAGELANGRGPISDSVDLQAVERQLLSELLRCRKLASSIRAPESKPHERLRLALRLLEHEERVFARACIAVPWVVPLLDSPDSRDRLAAVLLLSLQRIDDDVRQHLQQALRREDSSTVTSVIGRVLRNLPATVPWDAFVALLTGSQDADWNL